MNQLVSQQAGGALVFKGTVSEPANVTVGGKPATVTADNRFEGQAVVPGGTGQVAVTATDPSGNMRTSTYQVSQSASSKSFTYDLDGNMTSDGTRTYEWDAENRLVAVKEGGSTIASYTYNNHGIRTSKTAAGITTNYMLEGPNVLEERASSGVMRRQFQGLGTDNVLATQDGTEPATYLTRDHLGSIREHVTSEPGLRRDYDPWGRLLAGSAEGWAFTGREWDAQTGLYYYRARYYDPAVGRFVSSDPIGFRGGSNQYEYALNSPMQNIDPTGLLVQVRCERIGWHGYDRRTLAGMYRHCFVRTKCCKAGDAFDKTVEVGGTTQGQIPPLHINDFGGNRGSEDILTNPMLSEDCHLEKCILEKAEEVRATIAYDAKHQNSNTFVHRLITACGISGIVVGEPPTAW